MQVAREAGACPVVVGMVMLVCTVGCVDLETKAGWEIDELGEEPDAEWNAAAADAPVDDVDEEPPEELIGCAPPVAEVFEPPRPTVDGTRWGSALEGSVGTYVTWHEFGADGALSVMQDDYQYWEPLTPVRAWDAVGEWTIQGADVVFEWTHPQYDATYFRRHTWAPIEPALATEVQAWPAHAGADAAGLWVMGGMWRQSEGSYFGGFETKEVYDTWGTSRRVSSTILFDEDPCRISLTLTAHHEQSGETETGTETFELTCSMTPISNGWTEISVDGFSGDTLASEWRVMLRDRDITIRHGYRVEALMASHFLPRLFLSPSRDLLVHESSEQPYFDSFETQAAP